jgi:hypothetical protein
MGAFTQQRLLIGYLPRNNRNWQESCAHGRHYDSMKAFTFLSAGLGLALAAASLATIPASAASDRADSITDPVTVSVAIGTLDTPGKSGHSGIIRVRIGEAAPVRLMVDTGIVGVLLWGKAPKGAQISNTEFEARVQGNKLKGLIGNAPMTVGGVTTTRDVPFALIQTDSKYIDRWKRRGIAGIIGLSVGSGNLTNPLMSMPGELARGWSLHFERKNPTGPSTFGALVMGATAPTDALMHFTLPSDGVDRFGSKVWDDAAADGCWAFDEGDEYCVPTWFDSGFTLMRIKGRAFADLPVTPAKRLRRGTLVELAAGSSAFFGYRFLAGNEGSRNLVRVLPVGASVINTGNGVYFDYTVTYRVDTGDLYLTKEGLA